MNEHCTRWQADSCPENGMAYITDMLGTGFRDKMIATMGGMSIKVPKGCSALPDHHYLVRNLGRVDAGELVEILPGETVYVPTGNPVADRREAVADMVKAGKTNNEIACCLGISDRQVRRLRARSGLNGFAIAKRLGVGTAQLPKAIERANTLRLAAQ